MMAERWPDFIFPEEDHDACPLADSPDAACPSILWIDSNDAGAV